MDDCFQYCLFWLPQRICVFVAIRPRASASPPHFRGRTCPMDEAKVPPLESGTFIFPTGGTGKDTYTGEWKEREYLDGEEVPPPPEVVEGEDTPRTYVRHGTGTSQVAGKWKYEGEWNQDKMEGKGVFAYESGAVYDGQLENDCYHGIGQYTWPDGTTYKGMFEKSAMHGKGTYTDKEGREWTGDFYNNTGPGLKMVV